MNYNELIECINILSKKQPNLSYLEQLENTTISDNIIDLIVPKLVELIKTRTNYSIQNIIHELDTIFNDINILDYQLVRLKKEITIINRLLSLKHLPIDIKTKLKNTLKV